MATTPVTCPACGSPNSADAVFCANPDCHKALATAPYLMEVASARRTAIERLAESVARFAGHSHFITLHLLLFLSWFAWNIQHGSFDPFPYPVLGLILAIEACLLTGLLLIANRREERLDELRAELEYEVHVRNSRELQRIVERLDALIDAAGR